MDPKRSLFARAQPRVKLPPKLPTNTNKASLSFLQLPGEIRNKIYQFYFWEPYRCELVGEGCDLTEHASKTLKLRSNTSHTYMPHRYSHPDTPVRYISVPKTIRFSRLHRPGRTPNYKDKHWLNPYGALILVSKKVCVEALPLLYHQITFVFEAPRRITQFIARIPSQSHFNVTKLHLYYTTYGSPAAASDVTWQKKHIESWTRACKAAAKSFTCLRELDVDVWITEDAPKFNLRQKWLQPLLQFRRLTCEYQHGETSSGASLSRKPKLLTTVRVTVRTRLWAHDFNNNPPVAKACKDLHRLYGIGISKAMLGAKEDEAMDLFDKGWEGKHKKWQHHLGFARTGW
jgi:hypothetical protein